MFNIKDFGAIADAVTDSTEAIQAALNLAGTLKGTVYIPIGEFIHTGLSVPREVTILGENRRGSVLKMMPNTINTTNMVLEGPYTFLKNFTLDGNSFTGGTSGDGVVSLAGGGSYFNGFDNFNVDKVNGVGADVREMHSGHIKNCSFNRCNVGLKVTHCVALTVDSTDVARFTEAGVVIQGNPGMTVANFNGLYMETGEQETVAKAPFVKMVSLRDRDVVTFDNIYMFGHALTKGHDFSGFEIETPISQESVRVSNVLMKELTEAVVYTGVSGTTKLISTEFSHVTYQDSPKISPHYGVKTDDSYAFNVSVEVSLSKDHIILLPIMAERAFRLDSVVQLATADFSHGPNVTEGSTLLMGTDVDPQEFGVITQTLNTLSGTILDQTDQLINKVSENSSGYLSLTVQGSNFMNGSATYRIKGTVY